MKIGILTFMGTQSYGALLQAYALQKIIDNSDNTSELIYYIPKKSFYQKYMKKLSIKRIIRHFMNIKNKQINATSIYRDFEKKYLRCSKVVDQYAIKELSKCYDMLIVGSDQIWNCKITDYDSTYFLNFAKTIPTASYAASIGLPCIEEKDLEWYKNNLSFINKISVREDTAVTLIAKITGNRPDLCLDPTLLVEGDIWNCLIGENKYGDYVLVYPLIFSTEEMADYAKKYAEQNDYTSVIIGDNKYGCDIVLANVSVSEFVTLIYYAKKVITTSFHGIAMSINFQRQFVTTINNNPRINVNSRIESILRITGIETEQVYLSNTLGDNTIDYSKVNVKLENMKSKSREYLDEILRK